MNINKNLIEMAEYNPTKESRQVSIFDLCEMIDTRKISIPLYQRDLSWSLQKSIDLLNYQLLGKAPISPISVNVITNNQNLVPQVTFLDRELILENQPYQYSIVDGQQRLSTNYKAYINHSDFNNVVLDLGKGKFIESSPPFRNNQIPVGILLNKDSSELFNYISNKKALSNPNVLNLLLQINNKIKNYNYTLNSANDLTEDEQIQWFEVLNNAGSRVTAIQMEISKLKAHGIDIYKDYTTKYVDKIVDSGFELFTPQTTNVSYAIAALNPVLETFLNQAHQNNYAPIPSDTKEQKLCTLQPEAIKEVFEKTLFYLDSTLEFISENELPNPTRIDYINYLIGFFSSHNALNTELKEKLINWYRKVNFTNLSNTKRRELYTEVLNF